MAITQYDDPRWNPPLNPTYPYPTGPTGPSLDPNTPTYGATGVATPPPVTFNYPPGSPYANPEQGGGGSIPIVDGLKWIWKHLFQRTPSAPQTTTTPTPKSPSTTQQVLGMTPELIGLITALLNRPKDPAENNPALAGLNAAVPQLVQQMNAMLTNDVQRRQQSDPLYQAVLRGTMGGLPVWMRGGQSINPPQG